MSALLIGLGNPGPEYEFTRHNIGFVVVDCLAQRLGAERRQAKSLKAELLVGEFDGRPLTLVKPKTYMNLSGKVFGSPTLKALSVPLQPNGDMVVIYDDVYLPFGKVRLRNKGSDGGHNGIKSILEHYKGGFVRLRCGVGNDDRQRVVPTVSFVLERFSECELEVLGQLTEQIADCALEVVRSGFSAAANQYNNKNLVSL